MISTLALKKKLDLIGKHKAKNILLVHNKYNNIVSAKKIKRRHCKNS